jgi:hypothetical protein
MRPCPIEPHARAAFGKIGQQRIEEIPQAPFDIIAGLERIAKERIGGGRIIGHFKQ